MHQKVPGKGAVSPSLSLSGNDQDRGYLDQILAASRRAANLTKNLLAFSRKQIMSRKPVNINDSIRTLENMIHRLIGAEIELRTNLADGELTILADAGQIDQILMNLAVNARDAMPDGGSLRITTTVAAIDDVYIAQNGYGSAGSYACISIVDTGLGMRGGGSLSLFLPPRKWGKGPASVSRSCTAPETSGRN